ncbi:MAG: 50S ribosomal protein L20 [Sedimentisphaerales bacterium]|nr:50S ribosomal protein L20 [Sedimentisphaerales bacterium]
MPRVRKGAAVRRAKKRVLKAARGFRGARRNQWRTATESVTRAEVNARKSRKLKKRDYRGLWILRVNIACRQRGVRYSEFINGCKKANIALNRKMLSEIAIADPKGFDAILNEAKAALA